jgi:hypothetical protein
MQKQQKILGMQKQKNILKSKLKEDVKELKMLFLKLEKTLPEYAFEINSDSSVRYNDKKSFSPKVSGSYSAESEIDNIHSHLEDIEQRLKKIKG